MAALIPARMSLISFQRNIFKKGITRQTIIQDQCCHLQLRIPYCFSRLLTGHLMLRQCRGFCKKINGITRKMFLRAGAH